jgi:hypothetical protein
VPFFDADDAADEADGNGEGRNVDTDDYDDDGDDNDFNSVLGLSCRSEREFATIPRNTIVLTLFEMYVV